MTKSRLDIALVERGLVESRTKAQALIMAGLVYSGEKKLDKAGLEIDEAMEISIRGREHPWVSRGGMKLAHALEEFKINVTGLVAMDVGASTGGFTDVLLQAGAAKVFAVDVGHGQLDSKLRDDARVVVMEKTNARHLTAEMIADATSSVVPPPSRGRLGRGASTQKTNEAPPSNLPPQGGEASPVSTVEFLDIIVCDASFISLKKVLPAALALTKATAKLVTLIKPQFEVGKAEVSRGKGVIRDTKLHKAVCDDISAWVKGEGWQVRGIATSPITGPKGNVEFLLYAVKA
jgi:23S rRNA (cytidine1920-2'-O)/16S rRNA (cytidine1409-2'-O)-methyltransferase